MERASSCASWRLAGGWQGHPGSNMQRVCNHLRTQSPVQLPAQHRQPALRLCIERLTSPRWTLKSRS